MLVGTPSVLFRFAWMNTKIIISDILSYVVLLQVDWSEFHKQGTFNTKWCNNFTSTCTYESTDMQVTLMKDKIPRASWYVAECSNIVVMPELQCRMLLTWLWPHFCYMKRKCRGNAEATLQNELSCLLMNVDEIGTKIKNASPMPP